MFKKAVIITGVIVFIVLIFNLSFILAQRDRDQEEDITVLEGKLDKILSSLPEKTAQDRINREISAKLDQVLRNQQQILGELEVVKVRATRR